MAGKELGGINTTVQEAKGSAWQERKDPLPSDECVFASLTNFRQSYLRSLMMTEEDLMPYDPQPVPKRDLRHPSIRDDVRRTIYIHRFKPSSTYYSRIWDIYAIYLRDTGQTHDAAVEEKFRSALGRVLRPPTSSGTYALSFAATVKRCNGFISMVSPDCERVDPRVQMREHKLETGRRCREIASESREVERLRTRRQERAAQKANELATEEVPRDISFRYVDEFIALHCAEDLIKLKLFPNGKELAESMSAYSAVRKYLHTHDESHEVQGGLLSFRDPNVLLLVVGDGVTPRTAGLFAFRTTWRCVSIDPLMRSGPWNDVYNLQTFRAKVQDVTVPVSTCSERFERVVVVMWHCHVSISDALSCLEFDGQKWDVSDVTLSRDLRKRVAVVSCACCNYDEVQRHMPDGSPPDAEFEDSGVPGLMRTVRVWKHLL